MASTPSVNATKDFLKVSQSQSMLKETEFLNTVVNASQEH